MPGKAISNATPQLVADLRARVPQMLETLERLVNVESPSSDFAATKACAALADEIGAELLGQKAEHIERDGRTHLRWGFGSNRKLVLIGHLDTVWPLGTVDRWPFEVKDEIATGPGCFDMKGGVVQLFYALNALDALDGVTALLTTDEEVGSPTARGLIEETVRGAGAVLIPEPSAQGALKTERKGVSTYRLEVIGKAAHAGLDPEKGANAAIELAHQIIAIANLARQEAGTNVTPSVLSGGASTNTVPARATLHVDVRVASVEEQDRVGAGFDSLKPVLDGTTLHVERVATTPPMPRSASADLYALAQRLAGELGLPPLEEKAVGGGSDGNFTASLGIPTLDGLGAVGDGAHAEGEHILISAMPERAALLAALVAELIR
jgi:glutamate carboxypeptidase